MHAAGLGHEVRLWGRDEAAIDTLTAERVNEHYLPGVTFPDGLEPVSALERLAGCELLLVVVPSHVVAEVVGSLLATLAGDAAPTLISASKGVEVETLRRMSEVLADEARRAGRESRVATLSGPTFADELARGVPSAAVIAAEEASLAEELCERLASPRLRLYSSTDLVGVELGGTAKNVIALGSGMIEGLGLGHNTRAALITRGLREITRLGVACGGRAETFSGLAGLGDLVLTCTGGASRNLKAGMEIAAGRTLEEIQSSASMVAEGLINTRSVAALARSLGVEMPITEQMEAVIYGGKAPARALEELMTRDLKAESE